MNLTNKLVAAIGALPVKNAETMAKAAHGVLRDAARLHGQDPDSEVAIRAPGEARHFDNTRCWTVVWEAGPYDWAIPASMGITVGAGKLCEPYYGFDLCFYPSEDQP